MNLLLCMTMILSPIAIEVSQMTMPQYDQNGILKSTLTAQQGSFQKSLINLKKIKVVISKERWLSSPQGQYYADKKSIRSSSSILMYDHGTVLSGRGYDFNTNTEILTIHHQVEINFTEEKP